MEGRSIGKVLKGLVKRIHIERQGERAEKVERRQRGSEEDQSGLKSKGKCMKGEEIRQGELEV